MRDMKGLLETPEEDDSSSQKNDPNDSSILTAASLNKTHYQMLL